MAKTAGEKCLDELLKRVEIGEITAEQAQQLLSGKRPRGRPKKIRAVKSIKKRGKGRPRSDARPVKLVGIASGWVLYHDKIQKMKLRRLLAAGFNTDLSTVSKAIAMVNKMTAAG